METPLERAKALRTNMTATERVLWAQLRSRGLTGRKFRRQVPVGSYIADFLCRQARLIVEIDGASHAGREAYDSRRDAYLRKCGYRVLRISDAQVREDLDSALAAILTALLSPLT